MPNSGLAPNGGDRQFYSKCGALAFSGTRRRHHASMKFNERFHNRESHPKPTMASRDRTVSLREALENSRQELGFDARAAIGHTQLDLRLDALQFDPYQSLVWSKANRIGKQVPHDLLKSLGVTKNRSGIRAKNGF